MWETLLAIVPKNIYNNSWLIIHDDNDDEHLFAHLTGLAKKFTPCYESEKEEDKQTYC